MTSRSKRINPLLILVLVTANFALFLPSMKGAFLWDDKLLITENPALHDPHFLQKFLFSPFGGHLGLDENSMRLDRLSQFYRPVTSFSYWLDSKIWGMNPAAFHLTNILLHIINCVLLFIILSSLGWHPYGAFAATSLFSLFPLHFENVSWISGRTDLLSFFFAAISALLFIRFIKHRKYVCIWLSAVAFLFSLLAKENVILLPVIYFFIAFRRETNLKNSLRRMIPYAAGFLFWIGLRTMALAQSSFRLSGQTILDFFSTIGFYAFKILFPFHLSLTIDSARIFPNIFFMVFGLILLILFSVSCLLLLSKNFSRIQSPLIFAAFFLFLLPSVIVIFSASTVSFMAWRFLYLPSVAFAAAAVLSARAAFKNRHALLALGLIGCSLYALEIYPKNIMFGKSEKEFWLGIKHRERENVLALFNIGLFSLPQKETQALAIFNTILEQKDHPLYIRFKTRIYEELAAYFTFQKKLKQAEVYFNKLKAAQKEQSQHFYITYACYLALKGQSREGENIIKQLLELFPANHLILLNAAKFYIILKDYDTATGLLQKDLRIFPTEEIQQLLSQIEKIRKAPSHDLS